MGNYILSKEKDELLYTYFSAVGVNVSSVPEFMTNVYKNYTADYELSMRIDNPGEIVDFLI